MNLWPHQSLGINETLAAIERGERHVLLTSPTGMGKSVMMTEIIDRLAGQDWRAVLYTNRKMLVEQLAKVLGQHGIEYGIRAAGYADQVRFPVQISSLPTERSRVLKTGEWSIHGGGHKDTIAIVDEAHLHNNDTARQIFARHDAAGHVRLGVTATPLGLGDLYDVLIQAGTVSEGRQCGALVPCHHFAPTEPDMKAIRGWSPGQDYSENELRKVIQVKVLWGHVIEWYRKLNPDNKPTILFAPGVAESVWFAEQFHAAGIPAAHIDGEEVWINGEVYKSDRQARKDVLEASKDGSIKVLCNRFVLREGIDAPWLAHGIFATVFGSLQSYLQSGGRLLRACTGLESVTLQDHGGHWWRHGSLNQDRLWQLGWTGSIASGLREERLRAKQEREPFRCPECGLVLAKPRCLCGWVVPTSHKKSRPVIMINGELKEVRGDVFRRRAVMNRPDGPKKWKSMYFRSRTKTGNRTFRAAMALFAQENYWQWPDRNWPFMPRFEEDVFRLVADVAMDRLIPEPVSA